MVKKIISTILSILMLMQILPMGVFAEEINLEELTTPNYSTEIGDSYIIGEDISLRDETTKHFRCSDGRYIAATYGYPVHYEKDGKWEELDFTLTDNVDKNGNTVYTTKDGQNYEISVPEDIFEGALSYSYNGYEISLTYQGIANQGQENKTKKAKVKKKDNQKKKNLSAEKTDIAEYNNNCMLLDNAGSVVSYEDVETDTDFNYEISALGIKEDIIVKAQQNNYKYSYILQTGELVPSVESDNTIVLTDTTTNSIVYIIEAPIMYDNAGVESTDIKIKLKKKQDCYELVIEADKKWINADDRVFPVTIDPTVRPNIDKSHVQDTYVDAKSPNTPFPNDGYLYVGRNSLGLTRTYVKFTLPTLPKNSMIVSAAFSMFLYESDITTSGAVMNIYDLAGQSSWTPSTITWNNQPVSNTENGASGLTVIDYCDYGSQVGHAYNWDITKIAKRWFEGGTNNGILVAPSDETTGALRVRFLSSNSTLVSSVGIPQLTVAYRNTLGLEDYWSYSSYSAGDAGTAYVNDYNGNIVFVRNDVSTYGQRMPVTISHIYNLANANTTAGYSPLSGKGWQLSVQQSIISTSSESGFSDELRSQYPYIYRDGDGTYHYLVKIENQNKYEDEDGLGLTMTKNSSNQYVITDNNDNVMTFSSNGNILSIADANGNTVQMAYGSSTITSVTDGAGHSLGISSSGGNLTKITAPDGRACTYNISSGMLNSVTLTNGKTVNYTYDSSGRLLTATGSDGNGVEFVYSTSGSRTYIKYVYIKSQNAVVQRYQYYFDKHNITEIACSGNQPTFAVATMIYTVKEFDDFGRLICTFDRVGREIVTASNCAYVAHNKETDDTKNHIATVGETGASPVNYVLDPSFERSASNWKNSSYSSGSATLSFDSTQSLFGNKSLKINVSSYSAGQTYRKYQDLDVSTLTAGQTYTASVYAKVTSISSNNNGGVFLQAKTEVGTTETKYASEYIKSATDSSVNDGWQKLSVTFTVPSGVTRCYVAFGFDNAKGIAYFDGVQLEKGKVANDFNLIENAGFELGNKGWSLPSSSSDGRFSDTQHLGSYSYKVFGGPFKTVKISQTINLKSGASEADTYILSAWAQAEALSNQFHTTSRNKLFGIGATVKYSDNTTQNKYISGNFAVNEWQFLCGAFTLSDGNNNTAKTPVSITVYGIFDKQANFAYFDDFYLAKEDVPSYTYNSKGNLVSATDKAKGNQQMSYSADGVDMTEYRNAVSDVYTYTYDDNHNLTTATSTNGVKYNYTYDGNGNVTGLKVKSDDTTKSMSSAIAYTSDGSLVHTTTDSTGAVVEYTYDTAGNVTSVEDAEGNITSYVYDSQTKNLTTTTGTYKQTTKTGTSAAKTAKATYTYNSNNYLSNIKAKSDYSFTYDAKGNLATATAGDRLLVTNTYNQSTNALLSTTYTNGYVNNYSYDAVGRLTSLSSGTSSSQTQVGTWEYDGKSRASVYTDLLNSQKHLFTYDLLGRFVRESVTDTSTNTPIYSSGYRYDDNNNVDFIGVNAGNSYSAMIYTYSTDNLPLGYTGALGAGMYEYDALNRLRSITHTIAPKRTYTYYDTSQIATPRVKNEAFADTAQGSVTYAYDSNGNITKKTTTVSGVETDILYTYDEFNRLVIEQNEATNQTVRYKYDAWGNIALKWVFAGASTATPAEADLIKAYDYVYSSSTDMAWKDLLTKYDGQTITYDAIGNPLAYRGAAMTWKGRSLSSYAKNGTTITYSYDSSDMRTSKTVNGVKHNYYYVEGMLMYEDCPSYKLFYTYDANGTLSGIKKVLSNGTTEAYAVLCNMFGDVIGIYNSSKALVAKYTYDSWGKLLSITNASGTDITSTDGIWTQNSIRYRGYVYDNETKLYYLQSRYYDPETCRFINADDYSILSASPTALYDKNLFAYCDCNPVVRIDNAGNVWETVFDVVSLGFSIAEVAVNPYDISAWIGLVGDAIDLVPFVTGVGEITRGIRFIDKAGNTLEIAKAVDLADNAKKAINGLDSLNGFTKSTRLKGIEIHKGYKTGTGFKKSYKEYSKLTREKGIRPDYYDGTTIFELKPFNQRSAILGIKQLRRYNNALGGNKIMRLEFY